ncbi:MAG: prolyl oligopeptidase family serine peptidase [Planctomycetaceae bacterium]|nr:prolyl oligopeptidase family serine peptidase [Planctomycetaceae bacterium]
MAFKWLFFSLWLQSMLLGSLLGQQRQQRQQGQQGREDLSTQTINESLRQEISKAKLQMLFHGETVTEAEQWHTGFSGKLRELVGSTSPPKRWETVMVGGKRMEDHTRYEIILKANGVPDLPVYLLIPGDGVSRGRPAVVAIHGHGEFGHHAVAGRTDLPGVAVDIERANYDYGLQFVRRGYVVVCPCLIPFGDRVEKDRYGSDPCAVTFVRMMALGRVPLAENVRDIRWAVSFLQSQSEVDPDKIGCAGLSYGGRMTMMATAMEPRIKVAAISGALNLLQERTSLRYSCGLQIIPSLLEYGDYSEIGSLIAPRPAVWEMGNKDALIVGDGWDTKFKQRLERIYNAYGQRENLHYDHFDGGHRWNGDMAFPLFDQVLKGE